MTPHQGVTQVGIATIRTQNSYWLVNVSSVWVISQQVEVSGNDVFDQCVLTYSAAYILGERRKMIDVRC